MGDKQPIDAAKAAAGGKADKHPPRTCRCRKCHCTFIARQARKLCDKCHKEKRRADWRKYAKKRYKIEKNGLKALAAANREATAEAREAARAKAKALALAAKAEKAEAAAAFAAAVAKEREERKRKKMADVRRCKFCGKIAYGQDFCRSCTRDGFNHVYMMTGRSNGWERREAHEAIKANPKSIVFGWRK